MKNQILTKNKIQIGLIGYGVVGSGVAKLLVDKNKFFRQKFQKEFILKSVCDRSIHKKDTTRLKGTLLTTHVNEILLDPAIDVVIELIGGMNPAEQIVKEALSQGKHVITANKELIANKGEELFALANKVRRSIYFESSVGAGIPIIKTISEGLSGNDFKQIYGIINGTCNFILDEMSEKRLTFNQALQEAKQRGYAESDPTLDINGMDSTHKLAILIHLAFGTPIEVKTIYTEGIKHIAHQDIEHAKSLNLCIKLLGIAKYVGNAIEARVHPTLIANDHPLASIAGIFNAIFLKSEPMGNILLSGEGAGQMAAASGVISDLINLFFKGEEAQLLCNLPPQKANIALRTIDEIETKFYIRLMVTDKPGVLSKITGILGEHLISINSVTQKAHNRMATVPIVMLTDYTKERNLRLALNEIKKLSVVKEKPVAIRMEKLW